MAEINKIVSVNITRATATPSAAGFGIPGILTYHTKFGETAQVFSSASSMLAANGGPFVVTDQAYVLAAAAFAQNPRPTQVVVGRRTTAPQRTMTLTPVSGTVSGITYPLDLTDYVVTVNGQAATYTTDASATVAEITAGLKSAIDALSIANLSTTDNTTTLTVNNTAAGVPFTIEMDRALITQKDDTPDAGLANDITNFQAGNDDWYGLTGDFYSEAEINAAAVTVETLSKIMIPACADDDILTASVTDIASDLAGFNYERTALIYHQAPHKGIAAAWLGDSLPSVPGAITWMFRSLNGQQDSNLTATELSNLDGKNANYFINIASVSHTETGKVADGDFIDEIRITDWLIARIGEAVFGLLANAGKVPYTDSGVSLVVNEVQGVLDTAIGNGALASSPAPAVSAPLVANVSATDKGNRLLPDVNFTATLAGAVHNVVIEGTLAI